MTKEIVFKQDTAERKKLFTSGSFSHPAKMVLGLQIYLVEHYTKPGDTILDPMSGSGTLLVGCMLGRNVICVELEEKFVKMQQANWKKIRAQGPMLGFSMGQATILQGDARNLQGLLADKVIFSPPYAKSQCNDKGKKTCIERYPELQGKCGGIIAGSYTGQNSPNNIGNLPYGEISAIVSSPPYNAEPTVSKKYLKIRSEIGRNITKPSQKYAKYSDKPNNIGNLPYKPDVICTSPPYHDSPVGGGLNTKLPRKGHNDQTGRSAQSPSQAGAGKYNKPDVVISSPPYEEAHDKKIGGLTDKNRPDLIPYSWTKADNKNNIGNLKSTSYLEAMAQVYRECFAVLKDGGLMCIVVKNFIREKKIVRLDTDTIKLCETAGFKLIERLKRKLTNKSFWRILYERKYPTVARIDCEDILIFAKSG